MATRLCKAVSEGSVLEEAATGDRLTVWSITKVDNGTRILHRTMEVRDGNGAPLPSLEETYGRPIIGLPGEGFAYELLPLREF